MVFVQFYEYVDDTKMLVTTYYWPYKMLHKSMIATGVSTMPTIAFRIIIARNVIRENLLICELKY